MKSRDWARGWRMVYTTVPPIPGRILELATRLAVRLSYPRGLSSRGRETTCLADVGGRGQWEQTLSIRRDESLDPQKLGIRGPHIAQCQALISEGLT